MFLEVEKVENGLVKLNVNEEKLSLKTGEMRLLKSPNAIVRTKKTFRNGEAFLTESPIVTVETKEILKNDVQLLVGLPDGVGTMKPIEKTVVRYIPISKIPVRVNAFERVNISDVLYSNEEKPEMEHFYFFLTKEEAESFEEELGNYKSYLDDMSDDEVEYRENVLHFAENKFKGAAIDVITDFFHREKQDADYLFPVLSDVNTALEHFINRVVEIY